MLTRRVWMGLVTSGLLLAGAGLRADDKVEGDLKKMQGEWTWTTPDGGMAGYTFKGKTLTVKGQNRTYEITVAIDEKAKPDKTMDMKIEKAPDDAKGKTSLAIYKFESDDKLTICFAPEGKRPDKYENVGVERFILDLKRKK